MAPAALARIDGDADFAGRAAAWRVARLAELDAVGAPVAAAAPRQDPAAEAKPSVAGLVQATFVHARIGALELSVPFEEAQDPVWRARLVLVLAATAEIQARWCEWTGDEEKPFATLAKDLRKLRVGKGKPLALAPGGDLLAALGIAAPAAEESNPVALVLLPERADFLEYAAAVGDEKPALRSLLWQDALERWVAFGHDGTRALALSFQDPGNGPRGIPMDQRNPRALEEHVAQVAARALIERGLGAGVEPMFADGLACEMVIDVFGEADTYTDGDTAARTSAARSVFIPGGNPNGGILPPLSADSRWRTERGAGFFVGALRRAQADGGVDAPRGIEKLATFQLVSDAGVKRLVKAPFLGPGGSEAQPEGEFTNDHLGLLRAYRTAFLHWLRTAGAGKPKASAQRFEALLNALADGGAEADLAATLSTLYERPLSAPNLDEDCLEGDFLRWLAKQR